MSEHRVEAPVIDPNNNPKGPANYFPTIESRYGRPMQEWLDLVVERLDSGSKHMEAVAWLKDEHDMGHGHANAIVAYVKAKLA